MKAIMVMYDSLNRRYLEPYGCDWIKTPNFNRLAERTVQFERCYAGSMPCMPARREIHTGRHNFLHRSWGPLEPFDDSMPEILKKNGILSHLISDHYHYWEDGGATYHNRYSSWESVRGQEGDNWKGQISVPPIPKGTKIDPIHGKRKVQDFINRQYFEVEENMPMPQTFALGEEFIRKNAKEDNWFLQLETFDPHEPFFSSKDFLDMYGLKNQGEILDWPGYGKVTESEELVNQARRRSAALHSMCDAYLGKVLDLMDELELWENTMLIVCTDHGYMMGEHGWWAKNWQPCYDEIIHTPLFIYDPRSKICGEKRESLVATIDFAPTVLDFFGIGVTADMEGISLKNTIINDSKIHEGVLFGSFGVDFGNLVGVTDGHIVYMRAGEVQPDYPLCEYTLLPLRMSNFISIDELKKVKLSDPLPFTKGVPVLQIPWKVDKTQSAWMKEYAPENYRNWTFDMDVDPKQEHHIDDKELEERMKRLMVDLMEKNYAPEAQFKRLKLK